jgi:hypothetical protein
LDDTEVALVEGAGDHQRDTADLADVRAVHLVVAEQPQQTRTPAGRRRLDHGLTGDDPRVGAAQVVLDLTGAGAERRGAERLVLVEAERVCQMLVDVPVDRHERGAAPGEMAGEERGQRGLAAAALAYERDTHGRPPRSAARATDTAP